MATLRASAAWLHDLSGQAMLYVALQLGGAALLLSALLTYNHAAASTAGPDPRFWAQLLSLYTASLLWLLVGHFAAWWLAGVLVRRKCAKAAAKQEKAGQVDAPPEWVSPVRRMPQLSPRTVHLLTYWFFRWGVAFALLFFSFLCAAAGQSAEGVSVLENALGMCCFGLFGVKWLFAGGFISERLAIYIAPFFVNTIVCPACGYEFDAVGIWSKGPYKEHKERHIMRVRSPIDGTWARYTDCPMCDATILLR